MSAELLARFICMGCGVNTYEIDEYYMIHRELWEKVSGRTPEGILCVGCVEEKLGRKLTSKDFTTCPLNVESLQFGWRSKRLMDRLNSAS